MISALVLSLNAFKGKSKVRNLLKLLKNLTSDATIAKTKPKTKKRNRILLNMAWSQTTSIHNKRLKF